MASFYCTFCGGAITVTDPTVKTALCGQCKALLPVPANASVMSAGPIPIPNDAAPKPRGFPFLALIFLIPFAIMWLGVAPLLFVTRQWGGMAVSLVLGGGAGFFALWLMRQRWTFGRVVWVSVLAGFWGLVCVAVVHEHQVLIATFGPVQAEFSGFVPPPPAPRGAPPQPIKLKLLPLYLRSRDDQPVRSDTPALPTVPSDMDLYRHLPPALKPRTAADVQTIAVLDWGWDATTHAGICTVTLVDRKTHAVLASKILTGPTPAPALSGTNAHGTQPTNKDVIKYLESLPVVAEQPDPAHP